MMNTFTSMSCSTAVASSWQVITRLPSPATQTTSSSGLRDLGADRRRQAEAHRPEAARVDPPARLGEVVLLRAPHLVLADVGGDDRVAAGHLVERLDHALRRDLALLARPRTSAGTRPATRAAAPTTRPSAQRSASSARYSAVSFGRIRLQSPTIGMCAGTFLRDLGRVDVDVDELRARRELGQLAGDAVVEAGADGDDQVGVVHRVVGGARAVHAQHPEPLVVRCREARPAPSACR